MIVRSSSLVLPTSPFPNSKNAEFPVVIIQQPLSQSVPVGQTATFNVLVASNGAISYQWQTTDHRIALLSGFNPLPGAEVDGFWPIIGATRFSFTTPVLQASDNGFQFVCLITSKSSVPQSVGNLNINGKYGPFTSPQSLFTEILTQPVVLTVH